MRRVWSLLLLVLSLGLAAGALDRTVTLSLRDLPPASALRLLSEASGVQVVYLGGLEGRASLEVRDRPLGEVLSALLASYGGRAVFQALPGGGAVVVGPEDRVRAYLAPWLSYREYPGLPEEALKEVLKVGRYVSLGGSRFAVWATPEEHAALGKLLPLPESVAVLPVLGPEAKALVEASFPGLKVAYLEASRRLVVRGDPLELAGVRRILEEGGLYGEASPREEAPAFRAFGLRYLEPKEALGLLEGLVGKELVGKLVVNEPARELYGVLSSREAARLVEALSAVDRPLAQLELLVRVEQVDEQEARSLGLDWSATGGGLALSVLQGSLELSLDTGASAALKLLSTLKALETQGRSRTIVNTRLVALDGTPVKLQSGGKLLLPQLAGGGNQGQPSGPGGYFTLDYGLQVSLTPRVAGDEVLLEVGVNLGGVPASGPAGGVSVSNQSVTAKVRVRQGATTVLGGVVSRAENEGVAGVPVLSAIPLLGEFFKQRTSGVNRSVLLIMVSPRVLR